MRTGLTFDDVTIIPKYSEISSRDNVSTKTELCEGIELDVPIISANMDSISGVEMCIAMDRIGGLGILHRFMDPEMIEDSVRRMVKADVKYPAVSVGLNTSIEFVKHLVKLGAKIVCLDVAHGHHARVVRYLKQLTPELYGKASIIAGNVATTKGARCLISEGIQVVKVGIGSGSHCTTRVNTGCGVPQVTAVLDIAMEFNCIADGGIRNSGDITKALACGAKAVMIGNLFAGTDEAAMPDTYRGMASRVAQEQWKKDSPIYIEGENSYTVERIGPAKNVVDNLIAGVRSGMSYVGASNLEELRENAEFMQVTHAGYIEGTPHGKR